MRKLLVLAFLLPGVAAADFFEAGFLVSGFDEAGFFEVDDGTVEVPNVIGEADSTAAEMVLNAAGLVLGNVLARCSDAATDEVVGQDPAPGTSVASMTAVDVLVSNGIECASGRPGVRLRGLSIGL